MPLLLNLLQMYTEDVFPESIVDRCKEESCSLNLRGLPYRIIVKGERTCGDKICDCIIFPEKNNNIKLCIVELKSKRLQPGDIPEKLCNGAHIAFDIFKRCNVDVPTPFFLVLHKGITSSDHQVLSRERANLHGEGYPIRIKRCGSSLSDLLEDL